jgi:hypothetical protein
MANGTQWLVLYLERTGQGAKAEEIAQEAAKVYSAIGLQTMALLREKQNRLDEAEDWLNKAEERYGSFKGDLNAFHLRNAAHNPRYKKLADEGFKEVFKHGLVKFDGQGETAPPRTGIRAKGHNGSLSAAGIWEGAIIVALDGYRVENTDQYYAIRSMSSDDKMALVVFQQGKYKSIATSQPGRRFGVDFQNYEAR